jgi:hypothetical protein
LAASDGHAGVAAAMWRSTRRRTASRLSCPPFGPGNSRSLDAPPRSSSQARRTARASRRSGGIRSLRPLPWTRTWAPLPNWAAARVSPVSSLTRRPVSTATMSSQPSWKPSPTSRRKRSSRSPGKLARTARPSQRAPPNRLALCVTLEYRMPSTPALPPAPPRRSRQRASPHDHPGHQCGPMSGAGQGPRRVSTPSRQPTPNPRRAASYSRRAPTQRFRHPKIESMLAAGWTCVRGDPMGPGSSLL